MRRRVFCVFNCRFLKDHYASSFDPETPRAVIYEGVDTKAFAPTPGQHDGAHFAFLGRATREKGFLDFCKVMAALPGACVTSIDVIAEGPALAEGLSLLEKSGRSHRLVSVGATRREDVPSRLRSRSILLLPSYEEGLPGAVLEATAAGLCVVASAVGGVPELVRDGETGLTHSPGDFDTLLAQTRRAAESRELRETLARRGRLLVARRHSRERWVTQTLDVVMRHGAIDRRSQRGRWIATS
jgi:glycosyltransferase involved in cell wall biosynthesis